MHNDGVIRYGLWWSPHLQGDLDVLFDECEEDCLLIEELFDLLEENHDLRRRLAEDRYRRIEHPGFDTQPVQKALQRGYNISRVKLIRVDGSFVSSRILYAVDHRQPCPRLLILGLMPREEDYDLSYGVGRRTLADYDKQGVQRLG